MARPRQFDRDEALARAMDVFWRQGYEGTSLDELVRAMGIGRQSLYDTFGDKRALYLAALGLYRRRSSAELTRRLGEAVSPRAAIRDLFEAVVSRPAADKARGCMVVNCVAERAPHDLELAGLVADNQRAFRESLRAALVRAARLGELPAGSDPDLLARYLAASYQGLHLAAKAEPDPAGLHDIAAQMLKPLER